MKRGFIVLCTALAFGALVQNARAGNIFMDENFEGATPFVDQNWPVFGTPAGLNAVQVEPTAQIIAVKGVCLRSWDDDPARTTPKPTVANTGTVVSTRYFLGSNCLQLAAGQSVSGGKTSYVSAGGGEYKVFQFAVSTAPEAISLAPGTVIGHFKEDWSTTTTTEIQGSLVLQVRVGSGNQIEIYSVNTSSVIATMDAGTGNWALISMITQIRDPASITTYGPFTWWAFDPLTSVDKGPAVAPDTTLPSGIHVFVNSKTEAVYVLPDQIGTGWGNDNSDTPPDTFESVELGWEIVAENGTLFVDDMYWDSGYHKDTRPGDTNTYKFAEEESARMKAFDQAPSEGAPPLLGAKNWEILQ